VVRLGTPRVDGLPTFEVPDTLAALGLLARARRRLLAPGSPVVAVTGSSGKTSTREMIRAVLATTYRVHATTGNLNNLIGVPLTILGAPQDADALVVEAGASVPGEIPRLREIIEPTIAVITNVGYAHVEFFDSIEGVALAKRELIEALPADGVAVLNADDARVAGFRDVHSGRTVTFGLSEEADVRAENLQSGCDGTRFCVAGVDFETSLAGRHAVMNLLAAIAVARLFGIAPERQRDAVRTFTVGKMRGERLEHKGMIIWNDCYNSNPDAVRAMLDVLAGTPARRRVAVLGEMLELGHSAEALHRDIGRYVAERGIDVLVAVRGAAIALADEARRAGMSGGAAHFFEDPGEAGDFLRQAVKPGDAVLFKGSRGVAVERALQKLLG
jgi:UDP-N-acetylmuramoyl-tripeptide--D-alanyl-D-alanine ligase